MSDLEPANHNYPCLCQKIANEMGNAAELPDHTSPEACRRSCQNWTHERPGEYTLHWTGDLNAYKTNRYYPMPDGRIVTFSQPDDNQFHWPGTIPAQDRSVGYRPGLYAVLREWVECNLAKRHQELIGKSSAWVGLMQSLYERPLPNETEEPLLHIQRYLVQRRLQALSLPATPSFASYVLHCAYPDDFPTVEPTNGVLVTSFFVATSLDKNNPDKVNDPYGELIFSISGMLHMLPSNTLPKKAVDVAMKHRTWWRSCKPNFLPSFDGRALNTKSPDALAEDIDAHLAGAISWEQLVLREWDRNQSEFRRENGYMPLKPDPITKREIEKKIHKRIERREKPGR